MLEKRMLFLSLFLLVAMQSCFGPSTPVNVQSPADDDTGMLEFTANGEDFIRQGFTSKDGWDIAFDNVWANVSGITAYQTNPPYDPDKMEADIEADQILQLPGTFLIDLAAGNKTALPISVSKVVAPVGRYNALGWQMTPATEGEMEGYSLVMAGTAKKDGESLPFTIGVEESYSNLCGEYVGDTRKGFLAANGAANLEMTFHFDHIFGDSQLPANDGINTLAPGFAPFALMAKNEMIETDLAALAGALPEDEYHMLLNILPTLGHTGEGHCYYGN